MGHYVYVRNKKTKPSTTGVNDGIWPEKKRIEAITTYLATGNMSLTSKIINVPRDTLNKWKASPWWQEHLENLKDEDTIQLDKKLAKVVDKSLEAVNDRIENGDYQYDSKTGKLIRVPARLRDLHLVSKDMIDRRTIIQKLNTQKQEVRTHVSTEDRLLKLAETFAQLALGQKPKEEKEVTTVYEGDYDNLPEEYKDALYDQRGETSRKHGEEESTRESELPEPISTGTT